MNAIVVSDEEGARASRREEVDRLADAIAVHAARIDAATHELLTEIRRFDELGGWAWQGAKSCVEWLCWRVGVGVEAAGEKVRVARKLGELPRIDAAFAAGELSYCKVRAMTRVANARTEARLLEMARHATGAQLEKICRGFRRVQRAAALDEEARRKAAEPDRYLRQRHMPDGMVRIEMQLLPDEAEVVWQALERVRAELVADARAGAEAGTRGRELGADGAVGADEEAHGQEAIGEEPAAGGVLAGGAEDPGSAHGGVPGSKDGDLEDGDLSAERAALEVGDLSAERAALEDGDLSAERAALEVGDLRGTRAAGAGPAGAPHSAECLIDPSDPLACLFAPEVEEARPRGRWERCEQTGELVYYGSDPPDVWPEEYELPAEEREAALLDRARERLPSRVEWGARRGGEVLPDLADALVALADRTLSEEPCGGGGHGGRSGRRRRERPLLLVHLSEDRLAQALAADGDARRGAEGEDTAGDGGANHGAANGVPPSAEAVPFVAQLHGGAWLGGETLLRLACDGGVAVVKTDAESRVLDVGRKQRTIPPAILRALLVRDGHCQFPGCCGAAVVEAHHIEHWVRGGATRLDNLVLTCKRHHRALHEGGFSVARAADGALVFRDPVGRVIEATPRAAEVPSASAGGATVLEVLAAEQQEGGVVIDRFTSLPRWDGTAPDIGAAVSGLWWRHEHEGG